MLGAALLALERDGEHATPGSCAGSSAPEELLGSKLVLAGGLRRRGGVRAAAGSCRSSSSSTGARADGWVLALALGGVAFAALGVALAVLARDVETATLLAFALALPLAFLALVPQNAVSAGLYDVIAVVSAAFPFKPGARRAAERPRRRVVHRARGLHLARRSPSCTPSRARLGLRRLRASAAAAYPSPTPWPSRSHACAACAARRCCATSSARRSSTAGGSRAAAVRRRGHRRRAAGRGDARRRAATRSRARRRGRRGRGARDPGGAAVRDPRRRRTRQGSGAWDDDGIVQEATRAIKRRAPGPARHHRRVPVRVHEPRPLRRCRDGDGAVDNDATLELLARTAVSQARAGADIVAPSDMMDGRVARDPRRARRRGLHARRRSWPTAPSSPRAFYGPFREAAGSTPAAGDRRGYQMDPANAREAVREALLDARRGRRHGDGQAGAAYLDVIRRVTRRDRRCRSPRTTSAASTAMVKAAAAGRLARRAGRRARDADRDPPRRRRHRSSPTTRRTPPDGFRREHATPEAPQPQGRRRRCRSTTRDRALLNLMQGCVPARPAARTPRSPSEAGMTEAEVLARRPAPARRPDHPPGHADLRHPRARLRLDARRREGRPRAPAARRRRSSTRTPASPTTTCATTSSTSGSRSPSSRTRSSACRARWTSSQELTGAESIRQLPTLKLFKIHMDLEMEGDTEGARRPRASPRRRSSSSAQPYDELDNAVIRATQGDLPVVAEPCDAAAAERRACRVDELLAHLRGHAASAGSCAASPRSSSTAAPASRANGMGVWQVPGRPDPGDRPADGRLPRHLPLLPAPDLRGLALLDLHDGPRPLEGGVRRDPRRDRRRSSPAIQDRATLYSRTEFKKIRLLLLHGRLPGVGARARGRLTRLGR